MFTCFLVALHPESYQCHVWVTLCPTSIFLYTLKSYDNSLISYSNQFLSFDAHLNSEVTVQAICIPTHNLDRGCISPCVWSNVFWSWITQSFVKYSHLMTALETTLLDQNLFTFLLSEVKQKGHKWLNSLSFIKILQIKLDKTPFLRFTFFFLNGYVQVQVSNAPPDYRKCY